MPITPRTRDFQTTKTAQPIAVATKGDRESTITPSTTAPIIAAAAKAFVRPLAVGQ
jgi:hypothetical protein